MEININIGDELTKEEIEEKFNTNFGRSIKGITLRKWEDETRFIIIFSRANGPYDDKIEGNILYYDGEGQNKNQELTAANKSLIEANETKKPIYGFRQHEPRGKWEYLGILEVLDYNYITKNGFLTYEFKLNKTELDKPSEKSIQKEIKEKINEPPKLTENKGYSLSKRKIRDYAFSKIIKEIYENRCAICGKKRFTNSGYPEVEASHIYPKSKDGSDDPRNGISLCKLHHWAFDNGLLSINNDYTIIINPKILDDSNYAEIWEYKDSKIYLPIKNEFIPHQLYLKEHRKIHSFK